MAQIYKIDRVISAKGRKAQIIVRFHNRSVTRHIVDGVGWHPDDNVPRINARMKQDIADCEQDINDCIVGMAKLEGKRDADSKTVMLRTQERRKVLEARLASIKLALNSFEKEDPLMVRYTTA